MISRKLIRTDLNLLVALQILLEERNVTRAAERLSVSQPALSKTLQKLRKNLAELEAEEKKASSPEKKARLKRKRGIALTHVERANWLLKQLE